MTESSSQHSLTSPSFNRDTRSQTLIDFVVGLSLLLIVVSFTILFLPSLLSSFGTQGSGSPSLADRGADHLTQNILQKDGAEPYVLDEECTNAFFAGNAKQKCNVTTNNITAIVGHSNDVNVHVTLSNPTGVIKEVGDPPQDTGSTNTFIASRVVLIDQTVFTFRYRVW